MLDEKETFDVIWNVFGVEARLEALDIKDVISAFEMHLKHEELCEIRLLSDMKETALVFEGTTILTRERANVSPSLLESVRIGIMKSSRKMLAQLESTKTIQEFGKKAIEELKRIKKKQEKK